MPIFIPLMCLLGMGVARFRGHAPEAIRDDGPVRLLRWAVGMLTAQRDEWGRAMLGELDYIDGRGRRWRFAVSTAGAGGGGSPSAARGPRCCCRPGGGRPRRKDSSLASMPRVNTALRASIA